MRAGLVPASPLEKPALCRLFSCPRPLRTTQLGLYLASPKKMVRQSLKRLVS